MKNGCFTVLDYSKSNLLALYLVRIFIVPIINYTFYLCVNSIILILTLKAYDY